MSERMTSIGPLDRSRNAQGIGFTQYGTKTRAEMLTRMRRHYAYLMEQCQYVLNAKDEEFIVETHTGIHSRRNVREVTE